MKYVNCIVCGVKVEAKRIDKKYCDACLIQHYKEMRRLRDRKQISKERYKRYRATGKYKIRARKRYYEKPENQRRAHYAITNAVRDGRLKRPSKCENCGVNDWGIKRSMIEAHHHLGYDKKNWLKVKWLCTTCHKKVDRKGAK